MNTKIASVVAALALGLGGCATDPGMGGMVYRDGGYYAPARDGYGDYYVAPEVSDDWYGVEPFYGPGFDPFVFGPSWYGGGSGYCSVRYRYCPSGWYGSPFSYGFGTSLWLGFGGRHYDEPWGGDGSWVYAQPWGYRHRGGSSHDGRPSHRAPAMNQDAPSGGVGQVAADERESGFATGDGTDSRWLDANGDPRQAGRPFRRGVFRRQPVAAPVVMGSAPRSEPQPAVAAPRTWPVQRSGSEERRVRSEGGGRMRDGGSGTATRRRARND